MSAPITPITVPVETLCRRLHLANTPRIYQALAERAEREQWSYVDFLSTLLAEEIAHRSQTRLSRLTRKAGFPFLKTIDDFDFTFQSTLRLAMLGSYLSPDFVTDGRTLILTGKPSRGKTHLAIAIGYRAIQNGFESLFTTAAALIEDLSRASAERRLREALAVYTHPHVLIVDEVGYLSYGPDAANVLYHVVNARHLRRRAMVFTTNKSLRSWGKVLHDQDLADAIVERILERGRLVTLDGPSMRTRHLQPGDIDGDDQLQPAIISGIDRPDFLEPTSVVHFDRRHRAGFVAAICRGRLPDVMPERQHTRDEQRFLALALSNSANDAILDRLEKLALPDSWLVAGSLFQTVWNGLCGKPPGQDIVDYDVFYHDAGDPSWEAEDTVIRRCESAFSDLGVDVQVRNQARVHLWYGRKFGVECAPLRSTLDGIDHFLNRSSCFGVRRAGETVEIYAPFGFADVFSMTVRPNCRRNLPEVYYRKARRWIEAWPGLKVIPWPGDGAFDDAAS